jgi:WD40 repeat protein
MTAQAPRAGANAARSARAELTPRFRALTQPTDGSWLERCARLRHDPAALRDLLLPGHSNLIALAENGPLWPKLPYPDQQPDMAARSADEANDGPALSAAKAILAVALALADPPSASSQLRQSIRHWQRARVVPDGLATTIPAALFQQDDVPLRSVLVRADELQAGPPGAYTALIALAMVNPSILAGPTVKVPVLFDRHHRGGEAATLQLTAVKAGPTGLYPNPCRMAFLATNDDFAEALELAWAAARGRLDDRCVLWAVLKEKVPCNEIVGGSLGPAFAIALDELGRKHLGPVAMSLKELDHHCAATGVLDEDKRLRRAEGYPHKLKAAHDAGLRVIVPRESEQAVIPLAQEAQVPVAFAEDLPEAIRLARIWRIRPLVAALVVIIILALTAGAAVQQLRAARVERQQVAVGRQLLATANDLRGTQPVTAMALNVEAARLAPGPDSRTQLLGTVAQPYLLARAPDRTGPNKVLLSADGRRLLTANGPYVPTGKGPGARVTLWERPDRHRITSVATWEVPAVLEQIALSPDGRLVVIGSGVNGELIQVWTTQGGGKPAEIGRFSLDICSSLAVAFSPDGKQLTTACAGKQVVVWDVAKRAKTTDIRLPKADIDYTGKTAGTALSPDHDVLAWIKNEGTVSLMQLPARPGKAGLVPAPAVIEAIRFRPAGHQLAVAAGDGVTLWDTRHPDRPVRLGSAPAPGGARDLAFSPRGDLLATVGSDGSIALWDITNPNQPTAVRTLASRAGTGVAFDADGRTLAMTGADSVSVWDNPIPRAMAELAVNKAGDLQAAAFSPDGRTIAAATEKTVILWAVGDHRRPVRRATLQADRVQALRFGPNGTTLIAAADTGQLLTWEVSDPDHPRRLSAIVDPVLFSLSSDTMAFSGDGRRLALPTASTTITVWDTAGGGQLNRLAVLDPGTDTYAVALSSDGRYLAAAGGDGQFSLWDLSHPERPVATPRIATTFLAAVAFSPDDRLLAAAGSDGTIDLWDLAVPSQPELLAAPAGTSGTIKAVAFSPDTHLLVTAGDQQTASIWSITDPRQPVLLAAAAGPRGSIGQLAWSADAKTLLTAHEGQDAVLWDLSGLIPDPDSAVAEICATDGSQLSRADWAEYLPGLGYRPTC